MSEFEWMSIFADNLNELMQQAGISQNRLAAEAGISQANLSRYAAKKQMPPIRAIVNIAYVLRCDIRDLIDFGDMID